MTELTEQDRALIERLTIDLGYMPETVSIDGSFMARLLAAAREEKQADIDLLTGQLRASREMLAAARSESDDKIEGLEADLYEAVKVAHDRGAVEWARLNYPKWSFPRPESPAPPQGEPADLFLDKFCADYARRLAAPPPPQGLPEGVRDRVDALARAIGSQVFFADAVLEAYGLKPHTEQAAAIQADLRALLAVTLPVEETDQ